MLSQGLKWEEVGKLWGRGDHQHDQEAHNHPRRGDPPAQIPKTALLAHLAPICGVQARQCQVGSTPRLGFGGSLLTASAGNTSQATSHPRLKDAGRRYWVGRRQDHQGLYQHQKPMSRLSQTRRRAGGGYETEPSLNNHPVISVQSAEERTHPSSPFPALQGPYEKWGRGRTRDLQESEG